MKPVRFREGTKESNLAARTETLKMDHHRRVQPDTEQEKIDGSIEVPSIFLL